MSEFGCFEKLLTVADLCMRFPGTFEQWEVDLLESSAQKVLPVLTGGRQPVNPRQSDFVGVLMGKREPMTPSEIAWRRFVVLQKLALDSDRSGRALKEKTDEVESLMADVRALETSLAKAQDDIGNLNAELAAITAQLNEVIFAKPPEEFSVADIEVILDTKRLDRLTRNQMAALYNRMLMLQCDRQKLERIRQKLSLTTGWAPENAFVVNANTDGQ